MLRDEMIKALRAQPDGEVQIKISAVFFDVTAVGFDTDRGSIALLLDPADVDEIMALPAKGRPGGETGPTLAPCRAGVSGMPEVRQTELPEGAALTRSVMGGYSVSLRGRYIGWIHSGPRAGEWRAYLRPLGNGVIGDELGSSFDRSAAVQRIIDAHAAR